MPSRMSVGHKIEPDEIQSGKKVTMIYYRIELRFKHMKNNIVLFYIIFFHDAG